MPNTDSLNRTVFISDNLPFLRSLDSESVDLVVIDPPFGKNKKQGFEGRLQPPLNKEERKIEREMMESWEVTDVDSAHELGLEYPDADGKIAWFKEIWKFARVMGEDWWRDIKGTPIWWLIEATRRTHSESTAAYIAFMAQRAIELRRVLKPAGGVYLHCDHEANAYLRQMMDAVFGKNNFRNEITWVRHTSQQRGSQYMPKRYSHTTDTILFYAKSREAALSAFMPLTKAERDEKFPLTDENGERYYDDSAHIWRTPNMGARPNLCYTWRGFTNPHPSGWRLSEDKLEEEYQKGNIVIIKTNNEKPGNGRRLQRRKYERDWRGATRPNLWDDILPAQGRERTGYPTQKPQALARRIIEASSNPGDVVLDCFAGCAYVPVAAEQMGRRWVACDNSPRAWTIIHRQFAKQPELGMTEEDSFRVRGPHSLPKRTDGGAVARPLRPRSNIGEISDFRQKPLETDAVIWRAFVDEWGTDCWYCGVQQPEDRRFLQLDHVDPNKYDGTNDDCWNRALACVACNSDKGDDPNVGKAMDKALAAGRIQTQARRDEIVTTFATRRDWARKRYKALPKAKKLPLET